MPKVKRSGDKPCRFIVGTGGRAFPATARGLLEARLAAKRLARSDGSGLTYSVRLACGGRRPVQYAVEECDQRGCRKG